MQLYFYPEMNEPKPAAQIEARSARYSDHYFLRTPLTLSGRGIILEGTYTPETTVPGSHVLGWNKYRVTEKAYAKICAEYDVVTEILL